MNDKELELIKTALLHEDEGADYYLIQSQQWHEQAICDNFKQLSEEEILHGKWLREFFDNKKSFGDEKIMSFMNNISSPKLFDWTDVKKIPDLSFGDVFLKAMAMEEASYKYYQDVKESTDDETLHDLLNVLIKWEKSHYESLKEAYNTI